MKVQFGVECICQAAFELCYPGHGEDDGKTVLGLQLELIVGDVYDIRLWGHGGVAQAKLFHFLP